MYVGNGNINNIIVKYIDNNYVYFLPHHMIGKYRS